MQGSPVVFLLLALLLDGAAVASLELSRGLSRRLPTLVLVVCYGLSLVCLTAALKAYGLVESFELGVIYAAWSGVGILATAAVARLWREDWKQHEPWNGRDVGPVGTMARVGLGLAFVGSVVEGQLATHPAPVTWILGLLVFPGLALAWHYWRTRRHPAPFHDTSSTSFVLSVALPVALYLTPLYAPALSATSDGTLIFVGLSMLVSGLRGYAGCDMLAASNWLLHRRDQIACAVFTPIDSLDWRSRHSWARSHGPG